MYFFQSEIVVQFVNIVIALLDMSSIIHAAGMNENVKYRRNCTSLFVLGVVVQGLLGGFFSLFFFACEGKIILNNLKGIVELKARVSIFFVHNVL